MRKLSIALATTASLMFSGVAFAQSSNGMKANPAGETSGPASGGNVTPSTAVQKQGRSSSDMQQQSPAGGAPGVEGPAGSKNGPATTKSK